MKPNVRLDACCRESQTYEIGADVKKSGLFKCQLPEEMADSHPKKQKHPNIFIKPVSLTGYKEWEGHMVDMQRNCRHAGHLLGSDNKELYCQHSGTGQCRSNSCS